MVIYVLFGPLYRHKKSSVMDKLILPFREEATFHSRLKAYAQEHPQAGFVYTLYAEVAGNRIPVGRVGGVDQAGVLYIGQTTQAASRISLLFRSFKDKPPEGKLWRHGAEEIYWQSAKMQEKYPFDSLVVAVEACADSKVLEHDHISAYSLQFGEVPPFNGAIVKKKKEKQLKKDQA
jgi:hypothetical protein